MATDVNKIYSDLREKIASIHNKDELVVIDKAFNIANEYHGEQSTVVQVSHILFIHLPFAISLLIWEWIGNLSLQHSCMMLSKIPITQSSNSPKILAKK